MTNIISRSGSGSPEPKKSILYSMAVVLKPLVEGRDTLSLTAYFNEYPFPFEIDKWVQTKVGNDYRVVDSFRLEEIEL
jgi:hypothetical protein